MDASWFGVCNYTAWGEHRCNKQGQHTNNLSPVVCPTHGHLYVTDHWQPCTAGPALLGQISTVRETLHLSRHGLWLENETIDDTIKEAKAHGDQEKWKSYRITQNNQCLVRCLNGISLLGLPSDSYFSCLSLRSLILILMFAHHSL